MVTVVTVVVVVSREIELELGGVTKQLILYQHLYTPFSLFLTPILCSYVF